MQTIGILGGGQLARMMAYPAQLLGYNVAIFAESHNSPASSFAHLVTVGKLDDVPAVLKFANSVNFLTFETENIPYDTLKALDGKTTPNIKSIEISQNRLLEKTFVRNLGIKTAEFSEVKNVDELLSFFKKYGSCFLKTANGGYDGKGQVFIENEEQITQALFSNRKYIVESCVRFTSEASVILTRNAGGTSYTFPVPMNVHSGGILRKSKVPSGLSSTIEDEIISAAMKVADSLDYIGTMAVEFFITHDGFVFNEMAPRPHNSGHYTIDLCNVSQFENHIRAITGLACIHPKLVRTGIMHNILGGDGLDIQKLMTDENIRVHLYGKEEAFGRKMGHYVDVNYI